MGTSLTVYANTSSSDVEYTESGSTWVEIATGTDYLVFSGGSATIDDGQIIPSQSDLAAAGLLLDGTEQIVDRYFLADISDNELKEIFLMGNNTNRYVLCFYFDGATASEPILQLWDDSNLNTITGISLGAGTPSSSWWRGITTTVSSPSTDWTGTTLAGSGSGYYLNLNNGNGALAVAGYLYCNLKIVIPASATTAVSATPKIAIKFTSN